MTGLWIAFFLMAALTTFLVGGCFDELRAIRRHLEASKQPSELLREAAERLVQMPHIAKE